MSEMKGWIGVDLDGTLAHYDRWRGETHVGAPVEKMVGHVKTWLKQGDYDVKVFTARVSSRDDQERAAVEKAIHAWCEEHIGQRLEVVCAKDYAMVALFDDRATQVRPNTGITLAEECEELTQQLAAARAEVERLTKERNEAIVKLSLCKIGREEAQRDLAAVRKALEGLVGETEADALRQMEQVLAAVPHHPEQGVTLAAVRTLLTLAAQEGA